MRVDDDFFRGHAHGQRRGRERSRIGPRGAGNLDGDFLPGARHARVLAGDGTPAADARCQRMAAAQSSGNASQPCKTSLHCNDAPKIRVLYGCSIHRD